MNLDGDTRTVAGWIWRQLVPKSGQEDTVQGELLRAVEKLGWEAQNNGNANWNDRFEMLIQFLVATLSAETRLPAEMLSSVTNDLVTLANFDEPYTEDDVYDRLTEAVVPAAGSTRFSLTRPPIHCSTGDAIRAALLRR